MPAEALIWLDLFAAVCLLLQAVAVRRDSFDRAGKAMFYAIAGVFGAALMDALHWNFTGQSGFVARNWATAGKGIFIALQNVIYWLYTEYVGFDLDGDEYARSKLRLVSLCILFLSLALSLINILIPILYQIDRNGRFVVNSTGSVVLNALYLGHIAISLGHVLIHRRRQPRQGQLVLLWLMLLPVISDALRSFWQWFPLVQFYTINVLIWVQFTLHGTIMQDSMTGLGNRRCLKETLEHWLNMPDGQWICCAIIDIDELKKINDTYGHLAGDHAILTVARALKSVYRRNAVAVRYGGDEFAMLWRSRDERDAERMRVELEAAITAAGKGPEAQRSVRASVGATAVRDDTPITMEEILGMADMRMYTGKHRGKDRLK